MASEMRESPTRQGGHATRTDRIESLGKQNTPRRRYAARTCRRAERCKNSWAAVIAKVWLARRSRHVAPPPRKFLWPGRPGTNHDDPRRLISRRRIASSFDTLPATLEPWGQFISLVAWGPMVQVTPCVPRAKTSHCGGRSGRDPFLLDGGTTAGGRPMAAPRLPQVRES